MRILCDGNHQDHGIPVDFVNHQFTSKERDAETGLDYFGARYLSGAQGRFMSPDWSGVPQAVPYADVTDPQTLNLYSYVRNNPLSKADLDGHCGLNVACWQEAEQLVISQGDALRVAGATAILSGSALVGRYGDRAFNWLQNNASQLGTPDTFGGGNPNVFQAKDVYIDPNKYPAAAGHAADAQAAGKPDVLTVQRPGASDRRDQATARHPTQPSTDRDEYPPAVTAEGGKGASVRNIPSSDNRGAGASVGHQIKDVPDGGKIRIVPLPKPKQEDQ